MPYELSPTAEQSGGLEELGFIGERTTTLGGHSQRITGSGRHGPVVRHAQASGNVAADAIEHQREAPAGRRATAGELGHERSRMPVGQPPKDPTARALRRIPVAAMRPFAPRVMNQTNIASHLTAGEMAWARWKPSCVDRITGCRHECRTNVASFAPMVLAPDGRPITKRSKTPAPILHVHRWMHFNSTPFFKQHGVYASAHADRPSTRSITERNPGLDKETAEMMP
ncbi:hypothetical protein FBZ85_1123 [Azospirillum brasilense]|nr:hypothetical protein FBZ85_1123 [Azospirillum brasilense]